MADATSTLSSRIQSAYEDAISGFFSEVDRQARRLGVEDDKDVADLIYQKTLDRDLADEYLEWAEE